MEKSDEKNNGLKLIPIYEKYMEYIINLIVKLPRTEKFSIGTEFKTVMYETYRNIMYFGHVEPKNRLYYLNKIDADLNIQRTLLRIMVKNNWISNEKFKTIINTYIIEIGKLVGGLYKYYGKKIRNVYDKLLTYDNLMNAHDKSKQGKGYKKSVILFNLKKEEYIMWLFESLKNGTYKHGGYKTFYITEPKLRKIEASSYIDRIVHRWYVDNFLEDTFIKQFIYNSYACIKGKGMHKSAMDVQKAMQTCKRKYGEYYILKMDIAHYFQNINKEILLSILKRKIEDPKVWWLTKQIIYSKKEETGIPIRKLYITNICQYLFK